MLLWVVIYSYLPANNFFSTTASFVDEVEVLFSNVTFWATVVFSVFVALGTWNIEARLDHVGLTSSSAPRFVYKFASSAYTPLDKDIVREMWVCGDLKDRLGIRHRKASKNIHLSDLETAPMFREPHARSTSELTLSRGYEPREISPESDVNEKPPAHNSLEVDRTTPPLIQVGSSEMVDMQAEQAGPLTMTPRAPYYSSNDASTPTSIPSVPEPGYTRSHASTGFLAPESFEMQAFQPPYAGGSGFRLDEPSSSRPVSTHSWMGGRAL